MNDSDRVAAQGFERVACPGCGMMYRPLYEGHVCTGPADPTTMLAADRPAWWRLDNPGDVQVELLHRDLDDEGREPLLQDPTRRRPRHVVRVTRTRVDGYGGIQQTVTETAEAELFETGEAEFDALLAAGRIQRGMVHLCMVTPPALGRWTRIEPLDADDPPTGGRGIVGAVR